MDLNKAMIIGRLTRDPEVRSTPSGQTVASFSVATSFRWTDQQGVRQEKTEFHSVVAWRKLAEIIQQYLKKGSQVYIEGRLQTRSWDDQNGVKKYRTEIVADDMIMLGRPGGSQGPAPAPMPATPAPETASGNGPTAPTAPKSPDEEEINIEDIPF